MFSNLMKEIEQKITQSSNTEISNYITKCIDETMTLLKNDTKIASSEKEDAIESLANIQATFYDYVNSAQLGTQGLKNVINELLEYKEKYEFILMMIDGFMHVIPIFQILLMFVS